jgi:hypothetical protein
VPVDAVRLGVDRGTLGDVPRTVVAPPADDGAVRPARARVDALVIGVVALGALALTACGEEGGNAERFCGEIAADVSAVVAPDLSTVDGLEVALAHYRELADLAPAGVAPDWEVLVTNLETASTVVPGDEASMQRAVTQAYASEGAAVRVRDWLLANCGVDLGPVTTIAPQSPVTPQLEPAPGSSPGTDGG